LYAITQQTMNVIPVYGYTTRPSYPSQDTSSPAVVNMHTQEQTKRGALIDQAPQRKTCVISRREEGLPAPMTL